MGKKQMKQAKSKGQYTVVRKVNKSKRGPTSKVKIGGKTISSKKFNRL